MQLPLLPKDSAKEKDNLPSHSTSTPMQSDALSAPDSKDKKKIALILFKTDAN